MSRRTLPASLLLLATVLVAQGCGGPATEDDPATESVRQPAPAAPAPSAPAAAAPDAQQPPPKSVDVKVSVAPTEAPQFEVVRRYTTMFYEGELEALYGKFSDEMKEVLPLGRLEALRQRVRSQYGEETEVLGEDSQQQDEYHGFVRWARFSNHDGVIEIQWILRDGDTIAGFFIQPAKQPAGS
jgi:hypothetical protein